MIYLIILQVIVRMAFYTGADKAVNSDYAFQAKYSKPLGEIVPQTVDIDTICSGSDTIVIYNGDIELKRIFFVRNK